MRDGLFHSLSVWRRSGCGAGAGLVLSAAVRDRLRLAERARTKGWRRVAGFTLIELIIVISIMLILISIAAPVYRTSIIRSKEAVLRDDLFTLRSVIDQYTLDKQEAPQSLEDLVANGYLREIPIDPFTGSRETWAEVIEDDVFMIPGQTSSGITDVHSGSNLTSLAGTPYS